ncbi:DUF488 domain-containing protein [Salinibacterium sp. SYSU T00001]|uniref:DUF488 domain-containing protein n=1 Tax=Homoserinimonas sedimenticola TaxID=2986805 RepID=UPI0022360526|nr:DUF488 domain-containing protein [Salinibacterium sedimenticola]MCW4385437.1 DUF488 domain-containing protein [Salinibacterium sedimenticola]
MAEPVFTIGHSTRPLDEFARLALARGVDRIVDIRTVPKSRRNPQYWEDSLREELPRLALRYSRIAGLGGLRKTRADSPNTAWRNLSFRGYADYMQTPEFEAALQELIDLAADETVCIMCAEAVPWRCHRSLVGDALLVRGIRVIDIMSATSDRPESLTSFAVAEGTRITYPAESAPSSQNPA